MDAGAGRGSPGKCCKVFSALSTTSGRMTRTGSKIVQRAGEGGAEGRLHEGMEAPCFQAIS